MGESLKDSVKLSFAENFLLSGVAAIVSKTAAAPIERVKLLIQNQDEMIKQGRLEKNYTGITDCINRTYRTEGIIPFWRGNAANVLRYFPTQALNFAFLGKIKDAFPTKKEDSYGQKLFKNVASGGVAGSISLSFVYSLDYARTRLANDAKSSKKGGGERQFNGLIDVYKKTISTDGLRGIYRGFVVSCVGIFVYRGLYFGLYDTAKPVIMKDRVNVLIAFMLGYCVTVVSGLCSYPFDTVRRRMMMTSGEAVKYSSSFACASQIIAKEGFFSLFKGAGANILRGVAGAGVISGFDYLRDFYINIKYS